MDQNEIYNSLPVLPERSLSVGDEIVLKQFELDRLTRECTQMQEKMRLVYGLDIESLIKNEEKHECKLKYNYLHELLDHKESHIQQLQYKIDGLEERLENQQYLTKAYRNYSTLMEAELLGCSPVDLNPEFNARGCHIGTGFTKRANTDSVSIDLLNLPSMIHIVIRNKFPT